MNCLTPAVEFPSMFSAIPGRNIPRGVEALVFVLNDLLVALASATNAAAAPPRSAGVAWLRPLALATVELEYAVRHRRVDPRDVADACDDIRGLLDERRRPDTGFAARYATERASSATVARMHEAVLEGCLLVSFLTK